MIPVRLEMQGFLSFLDRTVIDFTQLQSSLFVITGDTGAGKSAIFDAMCYALYGECSRSDRHEIRCVKASDDDPTYVKFQFLLGEDEYIFTRKISAPNISAGISKRNPLTGNFETIQGCRGKNAMTEFAERLLHINSRQFRQIIMLPQGQLDELLAGNTLKKEAILKTLFRAMDYESFENILSEMSKEKSEACKSCQAELSALLAVNGTDSEENLNRLAANEEQKEKDCALILQNVKEKLEKSTAAAQEASLLQKSYDELDRSDEKLRSLQEREGEHARDIETAAAAQAAKLRFSDLTVLMTLREDIENAERGIKKKSEELSAAEAALSAKQKELAAAEQFDTEAAAKRITDLALLISKAEKKSGLEASLKKECAAAELLKKQAADIAEEGERANRQYTALIQQTEEITETCITPLTAMSEELSEQRRRCEALSLSGILRQELSRLTEERAALSSEAERILSERDSTEEMYHGEIAAVLAATLSENSPCPVCGSIHHPAPAKGGGEGYLTRLKALNDRLDKKRQEISNKDSRILSKTEELHRAEGECVGADPERLRSLEEFVKKAKYSRDVILPELKRQLEQSAQSCDRTKKENDKINNDINYSTGTIEALKAQLSEYSALPSDADGLTREKSGLEAELDSCRRTKERLTQEISRLIGERDGLSGALRELNEWHTSLTARLPAAEKKFYHDGSTPEIRRAEEEAVLRERMTDDEIAQLQEKIALYERELHAAVSACAKAKEEIGGRPRPDTAKAKADMDNDSAEYEAALTEHKSVQIRLMQLWESCQKAENLHRKYDELYAEASEFTVFFNLICGRTGQQISFTRYILGQIFDSIVEEANEILRRSFVYSGNEFTLERRDESGKRGKKGLDLWIIRPDAKPYPAAGLSGGEKFSASLSLTLGLSHVLQAENGGIELDTLMIDEGFGTLDRDIINGVTAVLSALSENDKTVGIISHVENVCSTILNRIDVRNDGRSSTAKIILP